MFARLFAESGLSLDRLRALVEIGAAGSIAQAAAGDPVRQSQYSRQIKELEDFFRTTLLERHGKGMRFTTNGRELARISRFFLLGLSNFQRGCLGEEHTYRIGASATFAHTFLLPVLAKSETVRSGIRYVVETLSDEIIERRLHELTLDFGILTTETLSRPLQSKAVRSWRLNLWVPGSIHKDRPALLRALQAHKVPLVLAAESPPPIHARFSHFEPAITCSTFLEAMALLGSGTLSTMLPDFLQPECRGADLKRINLSRLRMGLSKPASPSGEPLAHAVTGFEYRLAWNPRLLRLNPQAIRRRDFLQQALRT